MNILFVACLPKKPSFSAELASRLRGALEGAGHRVEYRELYAEGFDPLLDPAELARGASLDPLVQAHEAALRWAEGLLVLHPDWWGQPPALLKGWIDRVLRQGLAYELVGEDGGERTWTPLLGGMRALAVITSDSAEPSRAALFRSLWEGAVFGACGMAASSALIQDLRNLASTERRGAVEELLRRAEDWFGEA